MSIYVINHFKATDELGNSFGFTDKDAAATFAGTEERVVPVDEIIIMNSQHDFHLLMALRKLTQEEARAINEEDLWKSYFGKKAEVASNKPNNGQPIANAELAKLLTSEIDEFEFHISVRKRNNLKAAGIKTIRDLVKFTPDGLKRIKSIGHKSFIEIETLLKEKGLSLGMDLSAFPEANQE